MFAIGAGVPLFLLLFMWWVLLMGDLFSLVTGTGRLVPGMGARTLWIAAGATLLVAVLMAAVVGVPLGRSGWVFAVTALVLVEMAAAVRSQWRILLAFAAGLVLSIGEDYFGMSLPQPQWRYLFSNAAIVPFLVVAGLEGWLLVRSAGAPRSDRKPGFVNFLSRPGAPTSSRQPPRYRRLIDVLGIGPVRGVLGGALAGGLYPALLLYWSRDSDSLKMALGRFSIVACMLVLLGLAAYGCVAGLYKTRSEQALIRLAPGAPPRDRLNQVLARELTARLAVLCAGFVAMSLAMLLLSRASRDEMVWAMALFSLSPLLLAYVLRDFSRDNGSAMTGPFRYLAPPVIVDLVLMRALHMAVPDEVAIIVCINLAAGAAFVCYRWQKMCAAPVAFPAGRLAR
jgi:hypothetical protein